MTSDFAEDFCEAGDKEDITYLIVYQTGGEGFSYRWNLPEEIDEKEAKTEMLNLIKFCLFEAQEENG
jgi:hypothetical protein